MIWCPFGGHKTSCDQNDECSTAAREFSEETLGVFEDLQVSALSVQRSKDRWTKKLKRGFHHHPFPHIDLTEESEVDIETQNSHGVFRLQHRSYVMFVSPTNYVDCFMFNLARASASNQARESTGGTNIVDDHRKIHSNKDIDGGDNGEARNNGSNNNNNNKDNKDNKDNNTDNKSHTNSNKNDIENYTSDNDDNNYTRDKHNDKDNAGIQTQTQAEVRGHRGGKTYDTEIPREIEAITTHRNSPGPVESTSSHYRRAKDWIAKSSEKMDFIWVPASALLESLYTDNQTRPSSRTSSPARTSLSPPLSSSLHHPNRQFAHTYHPDQLAFFSQWKSKKKKRRKNSYRKGSKNKRSRRDSTDSVDSRGDGGSAVDEGKDDECDMNGKYRASSTFQDERGRHLNHNDFGEHKNDSGRNRNCNSNSISDSDSNRNSNHNSSSSNSKAESHGNYYNHSSDEAEEDKEPDRVRADMKSDGGCDNDSNTLSTNQDGNVDSNNANSTTSSRKKNNKMPHKGNKHGSISVVHMPDGRRLRLLRMFADSLRANDFPGLVHRIREHHRQKTLQQDAEKMMRRIQDHRRSRQHGEGK